MAQRKLNRMVHGMIELDEIDTADIGPTTLVVSPQKAFGEDVMAPPFPREKAFMDAPAQEGGFFIVAEMIDSVLS
jgi:Asp-tRNA(Asn)/Glu-tRNA(Gln) amidotransferase C subunit